MDYARYEQELVTNLFGWTTLGICLLGLLWLIIESAGHTAMPLERSSQEKRDRFTSLHKAIKQLNSQIERLLELHPSIKETSIIEGVNSNHYMDQGIIRDTSREYFFPIATPLVEWTNGDHQVFHHLNMNTNIKVEGIVKDYSISVDYLYGKEEMKVVFSSATGEFTETLIESSKKKSKAS